MKRRLKIGVISRTHLKDRFSQSGMPYYTSHALEAKVGDLVDLQLSPFGRFVTGLIEQFGFLLHLACRLFLRRRYVHKYMWAAARAYGYFYRRQIRKLDLDLIYCPVATARVACLNVDVPLIYMSDSTFAAVTDYYPGFSHLLPRSVREGNRVEQGALSQSVFSVFYSEWTRASACRDYDVDSNRMYVNVPGPKLTASLLPGPEIVEDRSLVPHCRLLLVGVDWVRKGGPVALQALRALRAMGIDAELTICGCAPPKGVSDPAMTVVPFLDKRDPEQEKELAALYRIHDLFLFPTQAECLGVVMVEAMAFGLPVLGSNTGGVPTVIKDDENGYLFPPAADGEAYAVCIKKLVEDEATYLRLVKRARADYEQHFNWDTWADKMAGWCEEHLNR